MTPSDGENLALIQPKGFPGLPGGWISETESFLSVDKTAQLFGVSHRLDYAKLKEGTGHRALVVIHGMGEHCGRYLHVPHYLHEVVDQVYCYDHRGHGRSQGLRGHAERFDSLTDDAALVVRRVHEKLMDRFGRASVYLLGNSLGGHVAIRTLLLYPNLPLRAASVTAPFLGVAMKVPAIKKIAALGLAHLWGNLQLTTELDPSLVSHDPEVCKTYAADRLVHGKMTPKFYQQLVRAMLNTLGRTSGIHVPLQILVPLEDRIVDSSLSQKFFKDLKLDDKELKTYPGLYHEILNELEKDRVFADIRSWIQAHAA